MVDETKRPEYITDADWDIIVARFERAEKRHEALQRQVDNVMAVAIRVEQIVYAHQPFIDRVAADAPPDVGTLDGRTFMTLARWAQYIEQCARPLNALQRRPSRNMPVTVIVSPGEYDELVAALANAKTFLEGVKVLG